jgi:hypothetical protein
LAEVQEMHEEMLQATQVLLLVLKRIVKLFAQLLQLLLVEHWLQPFSWQYMQVPRLLGK